MEISLIGKRVHVPKLVSDWLDFDRAFSAKVMAGNWRGMREKDLIYAGIQATLAAALVGCAVVGRDLKTEGTPTLAYSPSGEIVPVNMFGQDTIFYSAQPAFVELGLSARQVEVVQLGGSDQYTALQLMEVQDKKGETFYNLMFQGKNSQVKQEWAVLLADSPQSPESVLYQLDLVSENGHNVFVANMDKPLGNLTPTQLQINLPGENGVVPVPTADLIGLFTGVHPVLAADESTSTPVATLMPTPRPIPTETFTLEPTVAPTLTPFPSNTPVMIEASPTSTRIKITAIPPTKIPTETQPINWPGKEYGWPSGTNLDSSIGKLTYLGGNRLDPSFDAPGYIWIEDCRGIAEIGRGCSVPDIAYNSVVDAINAAGAMAPNSPLQYYYVGDVSLSNDGTHGTVGIRIIIR